MKLLQNEKYNKYVYEYIRYGLDLGLFDLSMVDNIKNKLLNIEVKINNNIQADSAVVSYNLLLINEKRLKNDKITSLVLFHEFTHVLSSIYKYVDNKNSILYKLKNKYVNKHFYYDVKSNNFYEKSKLNPNNYFNYGLAVMDEVLAESIATMMVNKKYNISVSKRRDRYFENHLINYECNFEYFGFEEHIINLFAKTLDLEEGQDNIFGLCKEIYNSDFIKNVIYQFLESNNSKDLYKIICYMGILYKYEEYINGRELYKFPDMYVYNIYKDLIDILNKNIIKNKKNKKSKKIKFLK